MNAPTPPPASPNSTTGVAWQTEPARTILRKAWMQTDPELKMRDLIVVLTERLIAAGITPRRALTKNVLVGALDRSGLPRRASPLFQKGSKTTRPSVAKPKPAYVMATGTHKCSWVRYRERGRPVRYCDGPAARSNGGYLPYCQMHADRCYGLPHKTVEATPLDVLDDARERNMPFEGKSFLELLHIANHWRYAHSLPAFVVDPERPSDIDEYTTTDGTLSAALLKGELNNERNGHDGDGDEAGREIQGGAAAEIQIASVG